MKENFASLAVQFSNLPIFMAEIRGLPNEWNMT
jgi:hypothetical protein